MAAPLLQDQRGLGNVAARADQQRLQAAQRTHSAKRRKTEGTLGHHHQTSLRLAKDSTEELRARTRLRSQSKSSGDVPPHGAPNTREGRQFTVGNIGNNGTIYLRCVGLDGSTHVDPPPLLLVREIAVDMPAYRIFTGQLSALLRSEPVPYLILSLSRTPQFPIVLARPTSPQLQNPLGRRAGSLDQLHRYRYHKTLSSLHT